MRLRPACLLLFSTFFFCFPFVSSASETVDHPPIVLLDSEGNEIASESSVPYSPKKTCGECHDYDTITNAYHFQQGRTDADGRIIVQDSLDSKNPWLISRGMYGKW